MDRNKLLAAVLLGWVVLLPSAGFAGQPAEKDYAVGAQYGTTHVYVAVADFDRLVTSLVATFGGTTSKQGVVQVTPTPSQTLSQVVLTPVGSISVFGYKTPIPQPFGDERTGYLVSDLDAAVTAARHAGAIRLVEIFPDPIGRDALVQWPGGVNMQFYWHTNRSSYPPLVSIPENRIYLTSDAADRFIHAWTSYSRGVITSDDHAAAGAEIGKPGTRYRRVGLTSGYGRMLIAVTDGALPWPYGREVTGYEVGDLDATLARAVAAGATIIVPAYAAGDRRAAMVEFPGGYIAEIHAPIGK